MSDEKVTQRFVVLPTQEDAKGKRYLVLGRIVDGKVDEHARNAMFTMDKNTRGMGVGSVYDVPTTNEGKSLFFGQKRWVGVYEDRAQVLEWQALEKAADLEAQRKATAKRIGTDDHELEVALEPLRLAYQRLPYPQRLGFELWVLSVLRRTR